MTSISSIFLRVQLSDGQTKEVRIDDSVPDTPVVSRMVRITQLKEENAELQKAIESLKKTNKEQTDTIQSLNEEVGRLWHNLDDFATYVRELTRERDARKASE